MFCFRATNIVSMLLGVIVITINIFFVVSSVSGTPYVQKWYFIIPISAFGLFYVSMCAYLVFHVFLSMGGDKYFANSSVSNSHFQVDLSSPNGLARKPARARLRFIPKYLFNDFKVYDKGGRRCDALGDSFILEEFELLLGDSSDSEFSLFPDS